MSERLAKKVVLIGWDAADWKIIRPLMEQGWMPTLKRFIDEGVHGNLATLEPILSPMLWTSIATGKHPEKHGIHGFVEPDPAGEGIRPVTSTSRTCKAIWNILTQRGISSNVVGWFASHPAEPIRGACVSNQFNQVKTALGQPWPMKPGSVHPAALEKELADLRVHPAELGKPHLQPFVPDFAKVDQKKDRRLEALAKLLAECATTHAVSTWLMEHQPAEFTAIYYDAIDHFCHGFMHFHPPRMEHVPVEQFELYKDVVTGCYKYHDMMLRRTLELAGDDATVMIISDHGFLSDETRPPITPDVPAGPAIWHRPYGVFCMKGPGIKRGEHVYGASLLDITPTILTLLGLPVGADMDGRVLRQVFEQPVEPDRVMSWEEIKGEDGRHPPGSADTTAEESAAAIQQLVDLGYIDAPNEAQQKIAEWARRELRFNLACSLIEAGKIEGAADILDALHKERPQDGRYTSYLLRCNYRLGNLEACRELAAPFMEKYKDTPMGHLFSGAAALAEGRADDAVAHLLAGEAEESRTPDLHHLLGQAYLKLERWGDAERAFGRAIDIDGDRAQSYDGLASALLHQDRNQDAADAALTAVGLAHHLGAAHFHLGVALARLERFTEAATAFEQCLTLRPDSPTAHQWLARIYATGTGDTDRAERHAKMAQQAADSRSIQKRTVKSWEF